MICRRGEGVSQQQPLTYNSKKAAKTCGLTSVACVSTCSFPPQRPASSLTMSSLLLLVMNISHQATALFQYLPPVLLLIRSAA